LSLTFLVSEQNICNGVGMLGIDLLIILILHLIGALPTGRTAAVGDTIRAAASVSWS